MSRVNRLRLRKFRLSRMGCIVVVFCAAATIASSAQSFTTLASFNFTNGADSNSPLIQGIDGNFYGTTQAGGNSGPCFLSPLGGCGVFFSITPGGTLTTVYAFCSQMNCADGTEPSGPLVQGSDGNFYGTTQGGGVTNPPCYQYGCGTVFKITPSGVLTTLYTFCSQPNCTDGSVPLGGLVQGSDGNFYGTTYSGGSNGLAFGTVFKITPGGTLTTIYNFCHQSGCPDGNSPYAGLVNGADGNFYGTTSQGGGGSNNGGTIFKITPSGTLTTIYVFCSRNGCPDGSGTRAGLVQGLDGNFYGAAIGGGAGHHGTVFKITPGGALTTLHSFEGSDGAQPVAGLIQGTDGNFYGTTPIGGTSLNQLCFSLGCGTLYEITPAGAFTSLHGFGGPDGISPQVPPVQGTDGNFYGTTSGGGINCSGGGCGTVFRLSTSDIPFVVIRPSSGTVGTPVTILGTNLMAATSVAFNGTQAPFNVVSSSEITTTVPAGATTGTVQVTIPGSTLISNTDFQVVGPVQLVPVAPCRLVDTRQTHNPIQGGTSQSFLVPALGNCGIPTSAAAYSLNVTVVPHGSLGYLTIWPNGEIQPFVSTMNSPDGRVKANAAIVPSGNNAVSVYVTDTTDLILDIDGYFTSPSPQTLQFYALPPCRVVDTRGPNGPLGGPFLAGGMNRDFPVLMSNCGLPQQGAVAYSFNFTALPHTAMGFITTCPTPSNPQNCPVVSTLNWTGGQDTANAAILPAGTGGSIRVNPSNDTDLLIDVNGYFAAPGGTGALSLYSVVPCRVLDTRPHPFQFALNPPVDVRGSVCAPPSQSQAYVFNATVVPQGGLGFLTLWPDGVQQPVVSTLNAFDGAITSNLAIVPAGQSGKVDAYASPLNQNDPNDVTNLILDISGYFAP